MMEGGDGGGGSLAVGRIFGLFHGEWGEGSGVMGLGADLGLDDDFITR